MNAKPTSPLGRFSVAAALVLWAGVCWHAYCHRATLFWDFRLCYGAASLLRHGQNPYNNSLLFTVAGSYGFPFAYPLPVAYLFLPFTFLSYPLAAGLWLGLTSILWGVVVGLWWRQFNGGRLHPFFPLLALLGLNLALPKNLLTGNVATVEALLLWTAFAFLVRKKLPAFAACLLAAAAFKLTPLLFLGLPLLHPQLRRWRTVAWGGALFALYLAAAYALAPAWFSGYQANVSFNVQQWALKDLINPSSYALCRRLVFTLLPAIPTGASLLFSGVLYGLLIAPVILISANVARRLAKRDWAEVGPAMILYATLVYALIIPRFSDYSYSLVIPAVLYAAGTVLPRSRSLYLIAGLLLPIPFISFSHDPLFLGDFSAGRFGLWSLLMVAVCWALLSRHLLLQERLRAPARNTPARTASADEAVRTTPRGRSFAWAACVCALLGLATASLYWPVARYGLINLDDPEYITWNPHLRDGLTLPALKWAFTTGYTGNWHPLTWLSYMMDYQLHGGSPGGMHLTNALLHAANALLLFLLLRRMVGALWRSAFVAGLFALHPLHVESVAWVAERKDVLSTCFGLLCLLAYTRYVEKSKAGRGGPTQPAIRPAQSAAWLSRYLSPFYLLSLCLFALSLMSKAMLVTLPLLLLLLDYWPLQRFRFTPQRPKLKSLLPLIWEKLPFLALSLAFSLITYAAQRAGGAVVPTGLLPLDARLANALMAYLYYLRNAFWPLYLSAAYPPQSWQPWQPLLAATVLAGLTWLLLWKWRRPYLLTGWLWFLGTLVPVIGLVQVGAQTMADRFMYFPLVGLSVCVAWGAFDLVAHASQRAGFRSPKAAAASIANACALLALLACAAVARQQVAYWRDSLTLFGRALSATSNNLAAHNLYGLALQADGRSQEAIAHYQEALRINPASPQTLVNLGSALGSQGNLAEAIACNVKALEIMPDYPEAHDNLGVALFQQGKPGEAAAHFGEAVRLRPSFVQARSHWAAALQQAGQLDDAALQLREALRYAPAAASLHLQLGSLLAQQGRLDDAVAESLTAVRLQHDYFAAEDNLADLFLRQGKLQESLAHSLAALRLNPDSPQSHFHAGAAYEKQSRTLEAIDAYVAALRVAPDFPEAEAALSALLSAANPTPEARSHLADGHFQLAQSLAGRGKLDLARPHYQAAVDLNPDFLEAHVQLGAALAEAKDLGGAVAHWRQALRLRPDWPELMNNLAWVLASNPDPKVRDGAAAVQLAERVCALAGSNSPSFLDTLGAAYAEAGRYADAVNTAERAGALADAARQTNAAARFRSHLELYRQGRACREP